MTEQLLCLHLLLKMLFFAESDLGSWHASNVFNT
jgi:hypothetical protein